MWPNTFSQATLKAAHNATIIDLIAPCIIRFHTCNTVGRNVGTDNWMMCIATPGYQLPWQDAYNCCRACNAEEEPSSSCVHSTRPKTIFRFLGLNALICVYHGMNTYDNDNDGNHHLDDLSSASMTWLPLPALTMQPPLEPGRQQQRPRRLTTSINNMTTAFTTWMTTTMTTHQCHLNANDGDQHHPDNNDNLLLRAYRSTRVG